MIGIGIDDDQIRNLLLDFLNLYLVSMYIYFYRNPLLMKSMEKVFWVFPNMQDDQEKWARLDKTVQLQAKWLLYPTEIDMKVSKKEQALAKE